MWEVGGIKIERTRARQIVFCRDTENHKKVIFLVKRSVPKYSVQGKFFSGLVPTETLRTQDSENIVGLGDRASPVLVSLEN